MASSNPPLTATAPNETTNSNESTNPSQTPSETAPTDNGYRYLTYGSFPTLESREPSSSSTTHLDDDGNATSSKPTDASAAAKPTHRALAPDLLRGLLMMLMAMDHGAIALHTWQHGTNRSSESDGLIVKEWNFRTAYAVRTMTHLCGSGFTFLLGMGVVYLAKSRTRMGWGAGRLVRYFFLRMVVLTLVTVTLGLVLSLGRIWFLNMVLFSLAVDYFLAGLLWLGMDVTEKKLAQVFEQTIYNEEEGKGEEQAAVREPLLMNPDSHEGQTQNNGFAQNSTKQTQSRRNAASLSWHIHNAGLLLLSFITIFWNIWLSDTQGHCTLATETDPSSSSSPAILLVAAEGPEPIIAVTTTTSPQNAFLRLWFWNTATPRVMSNFPPMAWLSFAILGLLYGRIVTARRWTPQAIALGHASAALLFTIIFVLTRALRFGNLSEDCLQTPAHQTHPDTNPYLVDAQSFFYLVKYPPDVAFWSFTMAGNLVLLGLFGAVPVRVARRFTILLDFGTTALFFYVVHLVVVFQLSKVVIAFFGHDTGLPNPMNPDDTRGISSLAGYFAFWAGCMLIMWPLCRMYSRFKSTKSSDSIWRFF